MHAWKSMEFISRAEKKSLSFAALTRSIYFSTQTVYDIQRFIEAQCPENTTKNPITTY